MHLDDKILTSWNGLMIVALSDYLEMPDKITIQPPTNELEEFMR